MGRQIEVGPVGPKSKLIYELGWKLNGRGFVWFKK